MIRPALSFMYYFYLKPLSTKLDSFVNVLPAAQGICILQVTAGAPLARAVMCLFRV